MFNERPVQNGQWNVNREEAGAIVDLGRELHAACLAWAKKQYKPTHMKIFVAAAQYVIDMMEEKKFALASDVLLAQELIEKNELFDRINEPFFIAPESEDSKKARAENLRKMADDLEAENAQLAPVFHEEPLPAVAVEPEEAPVNTEGEPIEEEESK